MQYALSSIPAVQHSSVFNSSPSNHSSCPASSRNTDDDDDSGEANEAAVADYYSSVQYKKHIESKNFKIDTFSNNNIQPLDNASIVKPMGTGWQFCDHHPSHKSFQTNAATFAIIVIIVKPFRLQHRDFLLRHSNVPMASRGKRSNANAAIRKMISAPSAVCLSKKNEKALPRELKWKSGLKWISNQLSRKVKEATEEPVIPLGNASIVKSMGTGWQFCDHHPSHKSFQTNAATFAIFLIIIAKRFRLQHRDFLLRHSNVPMASRGKRFFIIITDSSCVVIQNHFTIQEIRFFQHVNNFQVDRQRHPIKPVSAANLVECKRRYRKNDISAQSSESAQEERKSTPHRSQVEKWIEVDFEPVVAQSYRRTWYPNSCNPPNPQSSVTWVWQRGAAHVRYCRSH
nr:hypothetical protein Iba_chr12cCG10540 [Ipomoea batatas]